jgi:hypothetical protein
MDLAAIADHRESKHVNKAQDDRIGSKTKMLKKILNR